MATALTRAAAAARRIFDRVSERVGSVTIVAVLGALAGAVAMAQSRSLEHGCAPLSISLIRLEVAYSTSRFFEIFQGAGKCAGNVERSFVGWDVLFPWCYGPFLSALYLWTERWRRFDARNIALVDVRSWRRDAMAIAPLVAAGLDVFVENLNLWYAGRFLHDAAGQTMPLVKAAVLVGSSGALLKWLLLLLAVAAAVAELMSGPRGAILRRVRFSGFAVALGAVPLLATNQGQDILQRLFEGDHPAWRLLAAVPPLIFGSFGVWYFARKLTELQLDDGPTPEDDGWLMFFGEHIPRVLGVALLVLTGIAYARASLSLPRYVAVAGGVFLVALLALRFQPTALGVVGRLLMPRAWRQVPGLDSRVGQCVFAAIAGILAAVPPLSSPTIPSLYLRLAAYLCFATAWFFQLFVAERRAARNARLAGTKAPMPERPPIDSVGLRSIGPGLKLGVAGAAALSVVALIGFTAAPVSLGRVLGPLWIFSLAVVNAVFFGSLSVWASRRFRVPVVTSSLVLAVLFSLWNDNHNIRTGTDQIGPDSRLSVDAQLDAWLRTYHPDRLPEDVPLVLVAGAGGGLRAAYWTAISLATIADAVPSFENHFFAFSGVSGGSLGGTLFAALVRDRRANADFACAPPPSGPQRQAGAYATCVHNFMSDDFLSPLLAKMLGADFLQLFLPFPVQAFDRSLALEGSWEDSYLETTGLKTFSSGFLEFMQSAPRSAPVLVLNSTHVETGRRYMTSSVYRDRDQGQPGRPMQDAGDILDILGKDMPLATAVHNSARFTYASPSGHLESGKPEENGRVVDGGYFENSGLTTLREVYDLLKKRGANPYVLYLCNDPDACSAAEPRVPSSVADEVAAPIRALIKARDARGSLAQANMHALAGDHFLQMNVCRDLPPTKLAEPSHKEETRARVVSPPLGWLLSALARDWMDASLRGTVGDKTCYDLNATAIDILRHALPPL